MPREALAIPDIIGTQAVFPPETAELRIVDIVGLDAQADGGTHVASTRRSAAPATGLRELPSGTAGGAVLPCAVRFPQAARCPTAWCRRGA
jgi:hypothetical protein